MCTYYGGGDHNLCELSKLYMKNEFKYCLPLAMKMRMRMGLGMGLGLGEMGKWGNGLKGRGNASGKRCCRRRRRVVSHVLQIKMSGFHLRVINNHNKQIQTHMYTYIQYIYIDIYNPP